jgi:hypothetical protein
MNAKTYFVAFVFAVLFSCSTKKEIKPVKGTDTVLESNPDFDSRDKYIDKSHNLEIPPIEVIAATLPIKLYEIDSRDKKVVPKISDEEMSAIQHEIRRYYLEVCDGGEESYFSMKSVYLRTIQISSSSNYILYWIIFRHVSGNVNSSVLFYDRLKKEFSKYIYDFNIHGLYNEKNRSLSPTNLKELFKITFPEIEIVDFDEDEFTDFRFRRLYHNGTANAIEERIIEVNQLNADTLKLEQDWL